MIYILKSRILLYRKRGHFAFTLEEKVLLNAIVNLLLQLTGSLIEDVNGSFYVAFEPNCATWKEEM
jgi:hypothetical protein